MPYSPEEIADRMEMNDRLALYVHAFDALDFDRLDEVFTPDCVFDFTDFQKGTRNWEFMKKYWKLTHRPLHEQHVYHSPLITFDDDRSIAQSITKVYNPQELLGPDGEPHTFSVLGDYHDQWVKGDTGWRITRRRWQLTWIEGDYPFESTPGAGIPEPGEL